MKIVISSHMDVWDVSTEQPVWLNVGVSQIRWRSLDRAVMTLYSALSRPEGRWLYELEKAPSTLEIIHKQCGQRDEYISEEGIIRLKDCKLGPKWTGNVVAECPNDAVIVQIFVNVVGQLEILYDQG